MSVGSVGSSTNAYSYLQSLLQQSSVGSGSSGVAPPDPLTSLLSTFYPSGGGDPLGAGSPGAQPATAFSPLSPDTLGTLISAQGQQPPGQSGCVPLQAQSVFAEFDTNADGEIGKSEFESDFGANADKTKVDGLFNALDANGDGAIGEDEMTSAAQASRAHRHRHAHGSGHGQGGGLSAILSATDATDATGATTQTAANADGSSTTTIRYADGSTVSMTTPAAGTDAGSPAGKPGGKSADANLLEKLITWQSQLLASPGAGTLTIA